MDHELFEDTVKGWISLLSLPRGHHFDSKAQQTASWRAPGAFTRILSLIDGKKLLKYLNTLLKTTWDAAWRSPPGKCQWLILLFTAFFFGCPCALFFGVVCLFSSSPPASPAMSPGASSASMGCSGGINGILKKDDLTSPMGSRYGIFDYIYIYHNNQPDVGRSLDSTIHFRPVLMPVLLMLNFLVWWSCPNGPLSKTPIVAF